MTVVPAVMVGTSTFIMWLVGLLGLLFSTIGHIAKESSRVM